MPSRPPVHRRACRLLGRLFLVVPLAAAAGLPAAGTALAAASTAATAAPVTNAATATRVAPSAVTNAIHTATAASTVVATPRSVTHTGRWYTVISASLLGRRGLATHQPGATISYTFTGSSISLIGPKSIHSNVARIYLDGRYIRTVSARASTFQGRATLFTASWRTSSRHTITVKTAATRYAFIVNALVVRRTVARSGSGGSGVYGGSGMYGTAFAMDTLANLQVGGTASGGSNTYVAYRFRAAHTSTLRSLRVYIIDERYPGYGAGTGGSWRIELVRESRGVPSSTVLGSISVANPAGDFQTYAFSRPPAVTAGTVYDLVFINTDHAPRSNFVSLDLSYTFIATTPRQPRAGDADFGALRKVGSGAWTVQPGYTPILDLAYGNGAHQGNGYMEVEEPHPAYIGGSAEARERFTPPTSITVGRAAVRVARSTSSRATLTLRLEDSAGRVVASCSADASTAPVSSPTADRSAGRWVACAFASRHTLSAGRSYRLRATSNGSLWSRGVQQGDGYGFSAATYFGSGVLEASRDGGGSWATLSGLGASGDLQFYLAP